MLTYGVYISLLIRFAKACDTYPEFLTRRQLFVSTRMRQGIKYNLLCRKFNQFYRSHLVLSSCYSKSATHTYARASIVRSSEPVVIVAAHARVVGAVVAFTDLDFSPVPLSLFLGRSLFYNAFISSVVHELEFFILSKTCEKCRGSCHLGQGVNVSERV